MGLGNHEFAGKAALHSDLAAIGFGLFEDVW
jgi:hypothetical protein